MSNTPKQRTRISNLFANEVGSVREGTPGRSRRLIDRRNEALCDRYFFHQKINHHHYAKCLEDLSNEFYLSQVEVMKILRNQATYLNQLREAPPALRQLRDKWPWLNWE